MYLPTTPRDERAAIKQRFATEQAIAGAPRRIETICLNLIDHFTRFIAPNRFKAQVVTTSRHAAINYHPQSGWFDEGPSKGPPPCGRGLKPPEVLLLLVFFLFLLVADVVPNNGLV